MGTDVKKKLWEKETKVKWGALCVGKRGSRLSYQYSMPKKVNRIAEQKKVRLKKGPEAQKSSGLRRRKVQHLCNVSGEMRTLSS